MLPILTPSILMKCSAFKLEMIYNKETLNLFSDASMRKLNKHQRDILAGCYGSVAVCEDTIIEELYRENTFTSVPAAELRGIRCSLYLALKYRFNFRVINIFSDSLYSVQSLRDYCMDWVWCEKEENYRYNKNHTQHKRPIPNQELIYECLALINELKKTNIVNIIHQRGHIQNQSDLIPAMDAMKKFNGFNGLISYNVIRYVASYNNYVDNCTRAIVHRININNEYCDPVVFKPRPDIYLNWESVIYYYLEW